MIEVGALRALRSVAALGTLARAADELGFTASAVSQQIKRLERQVGVPVLAPAGRGVVLTPAGQAIVDSAPEVFQALERCAEAAQSVAAGAPRGVLRVVAFSTAIRGLLAPAVPGLARKLPGPAPAHHRAGPRPGAAQRRRGHGRPRPGPRRRRAARARCRRRSPSATCTRTSATWCMAGPPAGAARRAADQRRPRRPRVGDEPAGHRVPPVVPAAVRGGPRSSPDVRHLVDDFASQLSLVASGEVIALIPRLARPPLADGLVVPAAAAAAEAGGARGLAAQRRTRARGSRRCWISCRGR